MNSTIEEIYDAAVKLPLNMQSLLAEKLICHIEAHIDPSLEKLHLHHAKRRIDEFRNGGVATIEGTEALKRARSRIPA